MIGFIILASVLALFYLAICFSVLVEVIKLFKDGNKEEAIPLLIMLIMVVLILVSLILIVLGI